MTTSDEIAERDEKEPQPEKYASHALMTEYKLGFNAGFDQAIEMLRSFKDARNSLRIPAQHMADWLSNNKPRGVK